MEAYNVYMLNVLLYIVSFWWYMSFFIMSKISAGFKKPTKT